MSFTKTVEQAASERLARRSWLRRAFDTETHPDAQTTSLIKRMKTHAPLLKSLATRQQLFIGSHAAAVQVLSQHVGGKGDALKHYAAAFSTIEIPLIFHAPVNERQLAHLAEFGIRHATLRITIEQISAIAFDPSRWSGWMESLLHYAFPFKTSILLVLHERIVYHSEAKDTLLLFLDCLDARHLHIEFEHWTWNSRVRNESLQAKLAERSVLPIGWDAPQLPGLVRPKIVASRNGAHVRMLGRNAAGWFDPATKYQYAYKREELAEIATSLTPERPLYVTFVNDPPLQALANAIDFAEVCSALLRDNV